MSHSFLQGSSRLRDWTWVSCITGRFFSIWATRVAQLPSCCYWIQVRVPDAQWGQTMHWDVTVWSRKSLIARPCKETSLQTLHTLKECQRVFKGKVTEGCGWLLWTPWRQNTWFLQLSTGVRSWCSYKLSTRQVLVSILQLLSLLIESVTPLKTGAFENGLLCMFQVIDSILKAKAIEYKS